MAVSKGHIINLVIVMASSIALLGACNDDSSGYDQTDPPLEKRNAPAVKVAEKDRRYMQDAFADGLLQLRLADSIRRYGKTEAVKQLALSVSDLFSDLGAQLTGMAADKHIDLPAGISTEQQTELNSISRATGNEIDKAYLGIIAARYQATIDNYGAYAKEAGDADMKKWFEHTLPLLGGQLKQIKALQAQTP